MGKSGGGGGVALYFLGCRTAYKGTMGGVRGGEYYLSKPLWSTGKIQYTASGSPSSGLKRNILFLEIFSVYFVGRISEAAMGGPHSSFRARRSSVGCSVAQKGAA